MNLIRRIAGIIWIAIAPVALYYLITTALSEIQKRPLIDTKIQWTVFIFIFIPAVTGLVIFGYYALKGEYDEGKM